MMSKSISPLVQPVIMKNRQGKVVAGIRVEKAIVRGFSVELIGWYTPACDIELYLKGDKLTFSLSRTNRPDVSEKLNVVEPFHGLGFVVRFRVDTVDLTGLEMKVIVRTDESQQSFLYPVDLHREGAIPAALTDCRASAEGMISFVYGSSSSSHLVVQGWCVFGELASIGVETDTGQFWDLQSAYWYSEEALCSALRASWGDRACRPCFLVQFKDVLPWVTIRLIGYQLDGVKRVLSETDFVSLPIDPQAAALCLFDLKSPLVEFTERVEQVDVPVLSALISHSRSNWPNLSVTRHVMGERRVDAAKPLVSVVVPLFGRLDFVESQLLAFSEDPWLVEHAQLIYVLDDPSLKDSFQLLAEQLRRIYPIPFEWVYGGINRGYSGANNLGASFAKGEFVVFLNSDVFPIMPGWLKVMVNTLAENVGLGAVGPRLLFPDGSLQHAGMEFLYRSEWGVWINHHPFMGCPKELDPNQDLCTVPAVTGACLAMRKSTFDSVGGWDTGYLLGDFEDSDLCFKVRALGLDIGYLPTVELTHLERQSFKLVGGDVFRQKVVLYNAARHQKRWLNEISSVRIPEAGV